MNCPSCGSTNVTSQVFQENHGGATVTKTKSKYREKRHGLLWWLFIGWWWWIVDLILWIFMFIPRLIMQLFKKKKYKGKSKSVTTTVNKITYSTVYTCGDCGHTWKN